MSGQTARYKEKILILMLLAGVNSPGSAATLISGADSSYAGDELVFKTYDNMISFRETEISRCSVRDDGAFSCVLDVNETGLIFFNTGVYNCYFYAEPGKSYTLHLPRKKKKTEAEELNPYFEPSRVHVFVEPEPGEKEDLNFLIRAFNDSFFPHYYKYVINAATERAPRADISQDLKEMTAAFDSVAHAFFNDYMNYRIGLLKFYGEQQNLKQIKQDYFTGAPVLYRNPAYMELFNEVYDQYFLKFMEEHPKENLAAIINQEQSYPSLSLALDRDRQLRDNPLKELVLIKGIYDAFYHEGFSRASLLDMLDSLALDSEVPVHRSYARSIKAEITRLLAGYAPPGFSLLDRDSTLVELEDFRDSYVYLSFCISNSYECVKEFELLRVLHDRLKDHISIITVLMDGTLQDMQSLVSQHSFKWMFLHYGNQPGIRDDYEVQAFPRYFLIGPDGKLILSPAPRPNENFQHTLFRVMRSRGDI